MAVPHPQKLLQNVKVLAAKGLPAVTLVMGSNDFFRREAVEILLQAVPEDAELKVLDAVDVRAVGGRAAAADDGDGDGGDGAADQAGDSGDGLGRCPELVDLRSGGLFARRTILCIRRAKNWWGRYAPILVEQVEKFGKGCGVIIEAPKLDKRKRAVGNFVKHWDAAGSVFEFRDLWELPFDRSRGPLDGELAQWVAYRADKVGLRLTPEAAWMVVARAGKQPGELVAELERLRDQLTEQLTGKPGRPLTPADLRGKLTIGFESTPFELAEAVLAGDRRTATRSVRAMFARGVRGRDGKQMDTGGLFPFATSWLYLSLTRAFEGRTLLDEGVAPRDVPGRVGVRQFGDRFVAEIRKNDRAHLRHGLLALHYCQRMSRVQGEEPEILLERFLAHWFDRTPVPTAKDLEL